MYRIGKIYIDKAGGFWAWCVWLKGGRKPVFIGHTWTGAIKYVGRKYQRRQKLRARLVQRKLERSK